MNEAWMWYVAQERREAVLREVAEDRLAREARRQAARQDGTPSESLAARLVGFVWRWAHAGGLPAPAFLRPAEERVEIDRRWQP